MQLRYTDHRSDPAGWAEALGVSRGAIELYLESDVIDMHVESFSWSRVVGYDLTQRHGRGLFGARYYSQADLPRVREAQLSGAMWSLTTVPLGSPEGQLAAFERGLAGLRRVLSSAGSEVAIVRTCAEYAAARRAGKHGAFLAVQGGNAFSRDLESLAVLDDGAIVRITLVHMSNSRIGETSAPGLLRRARAGLSDFGREYVRALNARRIFVDLAHISRQGFFDALEVHDPGLPVLVTHTGVDGVKACWRNLDDEQLRAVARTGGTVGVVFHSWYLGDRYFLGGKLSRVVDHIAHIIDVVGDDHASLGSDFDGAIVTPRDAPTVLELPRIVEEMLRRGWSDVRIRKVLGGNFLRTLAALRG